MSDRANYFKIGLFVIGATALAAIGVVALGAGQFFKRPIFMETYLDETVQGLEVGSAVKRRGVRIGKVSHIDFVSHVYAGGSVDMAKFGRYVVIELELDPTAFPEARRGTLAESLAGEIRAGLRVRLQTQLTGPAFLDVNYVDPERNPPPEIAWTPRFPYVPSVPSVITKYAESLDEVIRRVQDMDFEGITDEVQSALKVVRQAIDDAKVGPLSDQTVKLIEELRDTNENLNRVLKRPEVETGVDDASSVLKSARKIMTNAEENLPRALDGVTSATTKIADVAGKLDKLADAAELKRTLNATADAAENLSRASKELPETLALTRRTMRRLDEVAATQQRAMEELIENLRAVSADLREITADAKRYPSRVLFGDPPPKSEPGKRR